MTLVAKTVATLAVSALVLTGCANSDDKGQSSGSDSGPLTIGVIVPLSGAAGPNGKHVLAAIEAETDLINQQGGVDGRQIEVVSRDDKSEPAAGVSAATDLVSKDVDVVMGGWNSPVTLALQPVLVRADIMNITTIPQNASILGGADDAAVRMNAGNAVGGYVAAKYLTDKLDASNIAMMLENDAYGEDAGSYLEKNLPDKATIATTQKFEYTDTDFRVAVSSVKSSSPDAVFTADAAESSGQPALMKQISQAGLGVPYFAALGTVSQNVIDLAGANADGAHSADLYFPDAKPWAGTEQNDEFIKAFGEKTGGDTPDKYSALGAMSVEVWAEAVKNAGSTDREEVATAIHGQTFDDTLLGSVSFTDAGQMQVPIYGFQVVDQKVKVQDEIEVPDEVWQQ